MFVMSNVSRGCRYILCYVFGQLSSVERLAKGTYAISKFRILLSGSDASRVQKCWYPAKTRVRTQKSLAPAPKCCIGKWL